MKSIKLRCHCGKEFAAKAEREVVKGAKNLKLDKDPVCPKCGLTAGFEVLAGAASDILESTGV